MQLHANLLGLTNFQLSGQCHHSSPLQRTKLVFWTGCILLAGAPSLLCLCSIRGKSAD